MNVLTLLCNLKLTQFAEALKFAKKNGVHIKCLDCDVTPDSLTAGDFVEVVI